MNHNKNAQIWYTDFIFGFTIFLLIVILSIKYVSDNYILPKEEVNEMIFEGRSISESLITEGFPESWNTTNVIRIGLTNGDYVLNISKLTFFANLTESDYSRTKSLLGTRFDFLVFFKNKNNITLNLSSEFIGKSGVTESNLNSIENPDDLVNIQRYLIHKKGPLNNLSSEIIQMRIYLWK
jgi:hypothetical protein